MRTNRKGLKTTIIASIVGALSVAVIVLWMMDKIDDSKLALGLSAIAALGATIIGILSKDASSSHTHDLNAQGTVNPDPNDPPPPPK